MPWIRRKWTPIEADEWTREDWIAIVLSPLCYFALAVGVALSILLMWQGFVILTISIVLIILMHWVIDPKLKAISDEYEKKQQKYLDELEETMHWK
jgi:ABC-type transport system involved in cytochrome bd biosynthesis fused ATPase/permease subunit